jgi:pimeloyl-ACP methyl ester carboxylesterase
MRTLSDLDPGLEIYAPDHRGTGRSARLGCADQEGARSDEGATITETEWPACQEAVVAEWGDSLAGFSSEGAARDVDALVARTREPGVRVVLHGASYGTTWAHRFLQLFPDGADGVVLDSTNWPDRTLEDYDLLFEATGEALFDACGADAGCSARLGADPWAGVGALHDALDGGHCPGLAEAGVGSREIAALLGYLLAYDVTRAWAPPVVYRATRCEPADVDAVLHAFAALLGEGGLFRFEDPLFSWVLNRNVVASELAREPTSEAAHAFAATCRTCVGAGLADVGDWPRYDFDEALRDWAVTDTPLLAENGGLDPFAPASRLEEAGMPEAFDGPAQRVLAFPTSPHGSVLSSPAGGDLPCGLELMLAFVEEPTAELDAGCVARLQPVDFSGSSPEWVFGTTDLWD